VIGDAVVFALLPGLPLIMVDEPWTARAVVARGPLIAMMAAVGTLGYEAAGEELKCGPATPPKPATERFRGRRRC
jgi:hypothetical protein